MLMARASQLHLLSLMKLDTRELKSCKRELQYEVFANFQSFKLLRTDIWCIETESVSCFIIKALTLQLFPEDDNYNFASLPLCIRKQKSPQNYPGPRGFL